MTATKRSRIVEISEGIYVDLREIAGVFTKDATVLIKGDPDPFAIGSTIKPSELLEAWRRELDGSGSLIMAPASKCKHGKGLNDYCEPCGRIHGG
jgi:hypothetical protein